MNGLKAPVSLRAKVSLVPGCSAKGFALDEQLLEVKAQTWMGLDTLGKFVSFAIPVNTVPGDVKAAVTAGLVLNPIELTT